MFDFFRSLFGTDFMPHLYCLRSDPVVLWLQVVSDLAIAVSYFAIPVVLLQVVRRRKDVLFRKVALLFVLFIAACGMTHLLAVWTIWQPMYRLEGVVKGITAAVSMVTALTLLWLRPRMLMLPDVSEFQAEVEKRKLAEEMARDKDERFESFVAGVPDYAMYMVDQEGTIRLWNTGAERLYGYREEEVVGKNFSHFLIPEERVHRKNETILQAANDSGLYEGEGWRVRQDGTRFWARVTLHPRTALSGRLRGFSVIAHDLTEMKKMEAKYQELLEAAPDGMLIVNRQGRIDFVNRRVEELFGYPRSEVLGKSVDTLVPVRFRGEHGNHRHGFFDQAKVRAMGAGRELAGLRRDGTEFAVEISLSPLNTAMGPVALAAIRDVTDRKRVETRFRALLESAPDAMVIVNSEGFIELTNRQTEKLFGYGPLEMVGQSVDMLVPLPLRDSHGAKRDSFFAAPRLREMGAGLNLKAVRKDGTEFPVEISLSPLEGPDGISVTAAIRDISVRREHEAELREKEERFRNFVDSVEDYAIYMIDPEGRVLSWNHGAERMKGYTAVEIVGESFSRFYTEVDRTRGKPQEALRTAKETGVFEGEGWRLRKDGSRFMAHVTLRPLRDASGQLTGFSKVTRDVTETRALEARYQALLEAAPDAMVISNAAGEIELVNIQAERLFHYTRGEMIGQPVEMLIPEDLRGDYGRDSQAFRHGAVSRTTASSVDLRARRKDGSQVPVEISFSPLEGSNGVSLTAAIRDISERKAAVDLLAEKMEELRHSNEALEQFAHIASHDLQEPLRMVASYTQLLSKRYTGRLDADADEFIAYAVDGTQRMKRLIEDLLLYSRAGKGGPPIKEFSGEAALHEAMNNLSVRMEETGASVTHDPLPAVVACQAQVVQILQNLIGNALKYRGERIPAIHVSAQKGEGEWIFSVADNGIGIDSKYFDRIFQIFQRLHGRAEYEGTGIGLAICQRILQQQGGRIWVESVVGEGSVFHFSLPAR